MFNTVGAVVVGFLLDALLGDPHWMPHPVRWMGQAIGTLEKSIRRIFPDTPQSNLWGGALLAVLLMVQSFCFSWLLLWLVRKVSPWGAFFLESWMCYQILAARALRDESMKVYHHLKAGDLPAARKAVGMIVGRDTECLSQEQVAKAAVETVAENTSDGVIAPLFYLLLGGAPLGFLYKAVNTLDSMVGYKNERYLYFGRVSARLDDLFNWIPSRLSALLLILAAFLGGQDGKGAWRIWRRDRRRHPSPNSAQTESACAGALGVSLLGGAYYGGVWVEKASIGEALRPVGPEEIKKANQLMYLAACLALLFLGGLRVLIG